MEARNNGLHLDIIYLIRRDVNSNRKRSTCRARLQHDYSYFADSAVSLHAKLKSMGGTDKLQLVRVLMQCLNRLI